MHNWPDKSYSWHHPRKPSTRENRYRLKPAGRPFLLPREEQPCFRFLRRSSLPSRIKVQVECRFSPPIRVPPPEIPFDQAGNPLSGLPEGFYLSRGPCKLPP